MKAFIVYSDYDIIDNQTYVKLFGRLENSQSFVTLNKLEPYFFIRQKDLHAISKLLEKYKVEKTQVKNFQEEELVKISSPTHTELNKLRSALVKNYRTYEGDIKPAMRFIIDNNLLGTIDIEGDYISEDRIDRVYREPKIKPADFSPKLKVISLDIEAHSQTKDLFCIGLYSENYKKVFIISNKKLENAVSCRNEEECLEKFKQEILKFDPDIITGWNVIDFDLVYLQERFRKNKIPFDVGRAPGNPRIKVGESFFRTSSADIPGRQVLDGLSLIKDPFLQQAPSMRFAQFESYKLDDAAKEILKDGKHIKGHKSYLEIDRAFKENPQKLVDYNLQDCKLVYDILEKTKLIELAITRSKLTGLPVDRMMASIAAFDSLYIREARARNYASPSTHYTPKEERLKGAYVHQPEPGIYKNVLILDFKSLYPSILRTFNIDPLSLTEKKEKNIIEAPNGALFKNQAGVLPKIIEKLHKAREETKKEKNELANYAIKTIMNSFWGVLASQNCRYFNLKMGNAITAFARFIIQTTAKEIEKKGYKVIYSDSVSGDTEVIIKEKGEIKFVKIRDIFKEVKSTVLLDKEYDFPRSLKVLTLDKNGKSVFAPIKYVMRHKANKKMYRIWFTNTSYIDVTEDHSLIGYLNKFHKPKLKPLERLTEVRPQEIGKKIISLINLKVIPRQEINARNYPKELYEFMGYFIGDGSFRRNKAHQKANKDYYLSLAGGSDSQEIIKRLINPLQKLGYIKSFWINKKGDITLNGLKIVTLIAKEFRGENNGKIIPNWLFEESKEAICAFLSGLFSADGTVIIRQGMPIVRFTNIEDKLIDDARKLLYLVGISNSYFKENKPNKYKGKVSGTYSKHVVIKDILKFKEEIGFILKRKEERLNILKAHRAKKTFYSLDFDLSKVVKIEEIPYNDCVYDIEVDGTHRFFANNILVHNTDSNFVETNLPKDKANALGKEIEKYINDFYNEYVKKNYNRQSFLELEFAKQYLRLMIPQTRKQEEGETIGAKKRYAGLVEKDGKEELEITGLEAIRGDWTDAAREFQRELLMKVFHNEPIAEFIKQYIKKIKSGELDKKLVYRKSIRKSLHEYTKTTPPHVKAARQLEALTSNIIEYYQTTEGPEPIQKHRHKIDYEHYIEKQIAPIANQVLGLLGKTFDEIMQNSKQAKLF